MYDAASGGLVSVLVVDDHEIVRRGIASTLDSSRMLHIVGEAASGERAIALAHALRPDVILMDLRMPGMGGLEAARRISNALPQIRIIAVTAWDSEPLVRLKQCGIVASVGKNIDSLRLEAVVKRVLQEQRRTRREVEQPQASCSPFDLLTSREMQVCLLLLEGERAPAIATRLSITPKTVHSFRYRIFERLSVSGDVELTKLAASYGLLSANSDWVVPHD